MNNLIKSYNNDEDENKRGEHKSPPKKKFDFKKCKDNTIKSLNETEYFLTHLNELSRYIKLYKLFK